MPGLVCEHGKSWLFKKKKQQKNPLPLQSHPSFWEAGWQEQLGAVTIALTALVTPNVKKLIKPSQDQLKIMRLLN